MMLDHSTIGEFKISMTSYTKDIFNKFPEEIQGAAATLAGDNLFKSDN